VFVTGELGKCSHRPYPMFSWLAKIFDLFSEIIGSFSIFYLSFFSCLSLGKGSDVNYYMVPF
jgi:hypothetical protein